MSVQTRFKGKEVRLAGKFIQKGNPAPGFMLVKGDLHDFTLANALGKYLILNIFPSLDTSTCAMTVREFNERAANLKDTAVLCISKDLPFAQSRFCAAEDIHHVTTLSDCRFGSTFGTDYGVQIIDGALNGLFARAVVILDRAGDVLEAELVEEITQEPDYDKALRVLANAQKKECEPEIGK